MDRFDVVNAIKSAIEEQFDSIVHEGNTELSWFDIGDVTREAADRAFDDQMIDMTDIISICQSCGIPGSPTGEGDILSQMQDELYGDILCNLDIEDMILDYVSDHDTAHLCESCAVAVVNNDFSSERLTATPEQVSAFIGENNPTYWVTYTELVSTCEICSERGANRVFKVTPKED